MIRYLGIIKVLLAIIGVWETAAITNKRVSHEQSANVRYFGHISNGPSGPLADWEVGLREALNQALLREGYWEPNLRERLNAAQLIGRQDAATPFGDVAVLARGQLYAVSGGHFMLLQDPYQNDCDDCHNPRRCERHDCQPYAPHNREILVALWTVKRLRHRDVDRTRFELEYIINPVNAENDQIVMRRNRFNYAIPGHVFVIRSSETNKYYPEYYNKKIVHTQFKPEVILGVDSEGHKHVLYSYPGFITYPPAQSPTPTTTSEIPASSTTPQITNGTKESDLYKKLLEALASQTSTTQKHEEGPHRFSLNRFGGTSKTEANTQSSQSSINQLVTTPLTPHTTSTPQNENISPTSPSTKATVHYFMPTGEEVLMTQPQTPTTTTERATTKTTLSTTKKPTTKSTKKYFNTKHSTKTKNTKPTTRPMTSKTETSTVSTSPATSMLEIFSKPLPSTMSTTLEEKTKLSTISRPRFSTTIKPSTQKVVTTSTTKSPTTKTTTTTQTSKLTTTSKPYTQRITSTPSTTKISSAYPVYRRPKPFSVTTPTSTTTKSSTTTNTETTTETLTSLKLVATTPMSSVDTQQQETTVLQPKAPAETTPQTFTSPMKAEEATTSFPTTLMLSATPTTSEMYTITKPPEVPSDMSLSSSKLHPTEPMKTLTEAPISTMQTNILMTSQETTVTTQETIFTTVVEPQTKSSPESTTEIATSLSTPASLTSSTTSPSSSTTHKSTTASDFLTESEEPYRGPIYIGTNHKDYDLDDIFGTTKSTVKPSTTTIEAHTDSDISRLLFNGNNPQKAKVIYSNFYKPSTSSNSDSSVTDDPKKDYAFLTSQSYETSVSYEINKRNQPEYLPDLTTLPGITKEATPKKSRSRVKGVEYKRNHSKLSHYKASKVATNIPTKANVKQMPSNGTDYVIYKAEYPNENNQTQSTREQNLTEESRTKGTREAFDDIALMLVNHAKSLEYLSKADNKTVRVKYRRRKTYVPRSRTTSRSVRKKKEKEPTT